MAKAPTPQITTKKHLARQEKERNQTRLLLGGLAAVFLLIIGVIVYGILDEQYFQANRVVAQVGDTKVTAGEFQAERVSAAIYRYANMSSLPETRSWRNSTGSRFNKSKRTYPIQPRSASRTLDGLINDALIEQEAKSTRDYPDRCRDRGWHAGSLWLFRRRHSHP